MRPGSESNRRLRNCRSRHITILPPGHRPAPKAGRNFMVWTDSPTTSSGTLADSWLRKRTLRRQIRVTFRAKMRHLSRTSRDPALVVASLSLWGSP